MLVEVEKIDKFPWSPVVVQIQTPVGRTAVRWCGEPAAAAGQYHVEWTIDEEICWGRNAKPATEATPALDRGGHCVIVRGKLTLTPDNAALLEFGGTLIQLDLADPIPAEVAGTWIELYLEREKIAIHPYEL